jgi:hypothetical protein
LTAGASGELRSLSEAGGLSCPSNEQEIHRADAVDAAFEPTA